MSERVDQGYKTAREALDARDRDNAVNWFTYHAPNEEQREAYERLRNEARHFALLIVELVPPSADRTASLRKLRECVMTANAGIACEVKS